MTRMMKTGAVLALALSAAGCMSSPPTRVAEIRPEPLRPAPTGAVASSQLPPPPAPPPPVVAAAATPPIVDAAAAPGTTAPVQTASAAPVSRDGLVGAWKVSSGGGNCQIFMALTKWTGGYRAASRGCPGQVADVSAWDVSGSQVVLKDSSGGTVANLASSGGTRYDGTTSGGQAISLYR